MKQSKTPEHLPAFIEKMKRENLPSIVTDTFAYYYDQVLTGETGLLYDSDISRVEPGHIEDAAHLEAYAEAGRNVLKNAVRITLNGGLGTSMGLTGPKSLLKVKDGKSFLEIIIEQTETSKVRLALMNSFSTHEATLSALSEIRPAEFPVTFLQHKFPKILRDDLSPAVWPDHPDLEWNPPGHGDIYTALATSGMLRQFLDQGIRYAFISNSDNLGASMDISLLGYFAEKNFPFMMEVAERTPADLKGGHLARHKNGRLILREAAQCPECELDAFRDIRCYGFFNTNNLWIRLEFLDRLIQKEKTVRLPMILNPKHLDPRDKTSPRVYQVETAMGAAISLFEGAAAVKVPRSRFFPVKKCNDLLAVRSDRFLFSDEKCLMLNPAVTAETIKITLDPKYYGKIDQFDKRFKGIPSLIGCESLTVEGDVYFEKNVVIQGNVSIKNSKASPAIIKEETVIGEDLALPL